MSSHRVTRRRSISGVLLVGLILGPAIEARAQQPPAFDDSVLVQAGVSVVSQYLFRGVRQNTTGVAVWPWADVSITAYSGDRLFDRVMVGVGFWNSLNTGDTGSGGPFGRAWYESRLYGAVGLRFGGGVSVATSYTAYTSPNDLFTTVKEFGVRLGLDDGGRIGRIVVKPYALVTVELDAEPGVGQLDGGRSAGRYLEFGVTPQYSARPASLAFPVKVGLSLRDYYELAGEDHTFGFASVGVEVTVPLGGMSRIGRWHVHGGVEAQRSGETARAFNGGDRSTVTASVGVGIRR